MTTIFSSTAVTLLCVIVTANCASYQRYGDSTSGYGISNSYGSYGAGNSYGVSNGLNSYGATNGYGSSYGSGYGVSSSYGYGSSGYPSSTSVPYRSTTYGSLGASDANRYPNYSPGYSTTRQPYNYNSYSTSGSGNLYSSSGSNGYNLQRYGEKYGSTGYGSTGYGTTAYGSTGLGSSGYGSSGYGSGSFGYGLGSSGYGMGSSGYGTGSTGYGSSRYGSTGLGSSAYGSTGLGSSAYGSTGLGSGYASSGYGSSGYGSSRYGSTMYGSSVGGYGSSVGGYGSSLGGYGSGGYNSYETPFMRDMGGCMNRSPQMQIFVESLMGMWYGVEVIQHTGFDFRRERDYEYERTCIVIHLSEPLDRPSTENQLYHVAALSAKFRQTHRHLRLLWDENGHTIEYPLYFRNDSAGYWHVLDTQNGTLTQRPNFQQFTGTVQVLSATHDHLVLNFCQEASNGRPAQLYSVFFSRNPADINSWELDSVHGMLQGKKLSIASRRMVCGNNGAGRALQSVFLSAMACFVAYVVAGSS